MFDKIPKPLLPTVDEGFFMFGCWNEEQCGNLHTPRNHVAAVIKYVLKSRHLSVSNLIIAGDNNYPLYFRKTERSIKLYRLGVLQRASKLIKDLNIPTHILLGNHEDIPCAYNAQLHAFRSEKIHVHTNNTYLHNDRGKYNFIFLNTNYIDGSEYSNFDVLATYIKRHINNKKPNVIVGHHPIYSFKRKKTNSFDPDGEFLKLLFNGVSDDTILFYLCADTHHFQISTLKHHDCPNKILYQIIVGTGGAHLDDTPDDNTMIKLTKPDTKVDYRYLYTNKSYGFLYVNLPLFTFFKINIETDELPIYTFDLTDILHRPISELPNYTINADFKMPEYIVDNKTDCDRLEYLLDNAREIDTQHSQFRAPSSTDLGDIYAIDNPHTYCKLPKISST